MNKTIAVIRGDGIGPEVVGEAVKVMEAVGEKFGHTFTFEDVLMGGCAIDAVGKSYPDGTAEKCKACDAVLLGAVGAPVFAGFRGGFASLLGTTGGYLVGFVLLTLIITFAQAHWGQGQWVFVLSAAVGLLVCYAFGTAWFLIVYTRTGAITLGVVLAKCVLPFLLPDAVKLALATLLRARLYRRIPA